MSYLVLLSDRITWNNARELEVRWAVSAIKNQVEIRLCMFLT